ncbi:F-box/WD repeat-containing protein 9-like isoform X1 [Dermacentor andersoni]|uniref:F-box/WD repeat-containing protein 9-like isoform X1 n=1 Tax=Dermacentor andersoni TaxID=34620 RepID=UPI00215501A0|nr:F-box/WD repeat-containing protein 9-like isoform X1 [Dermacentor andersoni]
MAVPETEASSLEALPNEILFKIFSLLDAQFIDQVIGKLCTRFALVLSDPSFWQAKLVTTWPKPYPLPADENFDWKEACVQRERHLNQWTNWEDEMKSIRIADAHIGMIHSVLLMNDGSLCVTGSRDRDLKVWDVRDRDRASEGEDLLLHSAPDAHEGWIWALHCVGNKLLTSSFDSTLKLWDVECGLRELKCFTVKAPVMTICSSGGEFVLGSSDGVMYRYDFRESREPLPYCATRGGVITCMAADDKTILAGTNAARLYTIDRRVSQFRPELAMRFKHSSVTALSFDSRQLWMGMGDGTIYTVDMTSSPPKIIQTVDVPPAEPRGMVSSIQHTLGSVLVSFVNRPMVALEPTLEPAVISWGPEQQQVTRFHFDGRTLATVGSEVLEVWHPKCKTGIV